MPFIRVNTNTHIEKSQEQLMTMELGVSIECISGKTEQWLMIEYNGDKGMAFAGWDAPCAMVEVDLLGEADPEEKNNLTANICSIVDVVLSIPKDRVYVRYLETDSWGFDGQNF